MTGTFPSLKQVGGHNTDKDIEYAAAAAAAVAAPYAIGAIAPAAVGAGDLAAAGAADVGAGAAAGAAGAGAPLDLLAGGAAAGTAVPAAVGDITAGGLGGAEATGLALEPGFASSALGLSAPGLDTSAAGLGLPGGPSPAWSQGGPGPVGGPPPIASSSIAGGSPLSPGAGGPALPFAGTTDPVDFQTIGPGSGVGSGDPAAAGPTDILNNPSAAASGGKAASDAGSGISGFLGKNSNLLGLLGLTAGAQALSQPISNALGLNKVPGSQNLQNTAAQEGALASQQTAYGNTLEQPLVTGQLPPGAQASVDQALTAAISTIKSRYGSLGLSGSTMESQAIAEAQQNAQAAGFSIEQQMAQSGQQAISAATSALGLESGIYDTLLNATISQDQQLGNAIGKFSAAVGQGAAIKGLTTTATS